MEAQDTDFERVEAYYRHAREGHVFIAATMDALLATLERRIAAFERVPRLLQLGSHAGITTETLLDRCPGVEVVIWEPDKELVTMAKHRLRKYRVAYHTEPLESLTPSFDLVTSIARHHHLPDGYLAEVCRLLKPGGAYVLADELCPEYCTDEHEARINDAEQLQIAGGYLLTSREESAAYQETGRIPRQAIELERLRRRALWRWYRYVIDEAVERDYFDIAVGELQSTHDDLITGSDAEHKFSPRIVERQFSLAGLHQLSKRMIGPSEEPERQSMFVYEYGLDLGGRSSGA